MIITIIRNGGKGKDEIAKLLLLFTEHFSIFIQTILKGNS